MPREYKKLKVYNLSDELVIDIYRSTNKFPRSELFALTSQMRRASVSVVANIVEGCARHSEPDYLHFLDMAYGSARELQYQISVAERLGYLKQADEIKLLSEKTAKQLNALICALRNP